MGTFVYAKINTVYRHIKPVLTMTGKPGLLIICFLFAPGMFLQVAAQPQSLEMTGSSATANNTTPVTTARTITLLRNTDNPGGTTFVSASLALNAVFSIANQQYTSIQGAPSTPGIAFGGGTANGNDLPPAAPDFVTVGSTGNPLASYFSSTAANTGTGISLAGNSNVKMVIYADALINSSHMPIVPVNATNNYFGDLVISFNQPVTNPVIHFAGMGADVENVPTSANWWYHGMSVRFTLPAGSPYTLTRLSGNTYFNVTGNVVKNSATNMGYNSQGNTAITSGATTTLPTAAYGASGSVQVTGTNITSLTLRVALDGDAGQYAGTYTQDSINWSFTNPGTGGDLFGISLSVAAYVVSGNVFNDSNALSDNTVNGTGTNLSNALYAVIYDSTTNAIAAVVPVAANGTYTATGMLEGHNYSVVITNSSTYTVGAAAMPSATLPAGWASAGEHLGAAAGSDGTVDGKLVIGTLSGNVGNANFGIHKLSNPLPITLISFDAAANSHNVLLQWVTSLEVNSASFDILRSTEGLNWARIGNVAATGQHQGLTTTYDFMDAAPVAGKNFYRLQLNDIDGRSEYSKIVTVLTGQPDAAPVVLYPNPVTNGRITLLGHAAMKEMIITDVAGRCIMKIALTATSDEIDVSALMAGYYTCTIIDKDNQVAGRISLAVSK